MSYQRRIEQTLVVRKDIRETLELPQRITPFVETRTAPAVSITQLTLHFLGAEGTLTVELSNSGVSLGRGNVPMVNSSQHLDLSPFGAAHMGVSRVHAAITQKQNQVVIQDLGSRNGTYLNGRFLEPYRFVPLMNYDTVELGNLGVRLSF